MNKTESAPPAVTFAKGRLSGVIVEGLIGSIMIMFGSFAVGWLAPGSPLHRVGLFVALRLSEVGVVTGTIVLTLGCWLLFRAWIRLGTVLGLTGRTAVAIDGRERSKLLALTTGLWILPQMLCLPIFSRDVFAYIGQGRVVVAGLDPYESTVSAISNWFQLGTDVTWAASQTAYGPLFYWIEAGVVSLTGENTEAGIFLFRVASLAGVVLCYVYLRKLAGLLGTDADRASWITVANPLFSLSFVASAHNDSLMVGFALAATYYAARSRAVLSIVFITASIGIKPITLVLLPFLGLLLAGKAASWGKKILWWCAVGGGTLLLMGLLGMIGGYGFGWLKAMFAAGTGATIFAPLGIADVVLSGLSHAFGLPADWVLPALKVAGRLLAFAILLFVIFRGQYSKLVQRMTIGFAAVVVLSPVIQPWYLLWLLPFFAATGIRTDWQSLWAYVTVAFFIGWGAMDQLYVWQFFDGLQAMLSQLVVVLSLVCALWIMLFDPQTRPEYAYTIRGMRLTRALKDRRKNRASHPPKQPSAADGKSG